MSFVLLFLSQCENPWFLMKLPHLLTFNVNFVAFAPAISTLKVCVCARVNVCVCACVCVHMHVCVCVCVYAHEFRCLKRPAGLDPLGLK